MFDLGIVDAIPWEPDFITVYFACGCDITFTSDGGEADDVIYTICEREYLAFTQHGGA